MRMSRRHFLGGSTALFVAAPHGVLAMSPAQFRSSAALGAINAVRARNGRKALVLDGVLNGLASRTARHLARLEVMTHAPEGQQLRERVASIGYRGRVAENLADGYVTFEQAIKAWLASGYHRTTMLSPRYLRFGAAVAVSANAVPGETGIFWVTEFGE